MTTKSPTKFTTIAIDAEIAKEFFELDVDFHGMKIDNRSQKLNALIQLYKQNYKNNS